MRARTIPASAITLAALFCTLLLGAVEAQAQGRVEFTKMYISNCEEMGSCEFRLTCQTGGKPEVMIPAAIATNPETVKINKTIAVTAFPAKVTCTLYEDDGLFGESWDEAATGSVTLAGGGDYQLELDNPEQATVTVHLLADSLQAVTTASAAPATGKAAATPAKQFLGIFRKESEPRGHATLLGMDTATFQRRTKELAGQGLHPVDIETWTEGGQRRWAGIFRGGVDASEIVNPMEWEKFTARWKQLTEAKNEDEQMRLVDMEIYQEGGKTLFTGAFRSGTESHSLWIGQDRPAFLTKWQELMNQGLRLVDLEVYKVGGRNLYAGVFLEVDGGYGIWTNTDWDAFQAKWKGAGSGLSDVESYMEGNKRVFDGVILSGGGTEEMPPMSDARSFAAKWNDMLAKGYRLIHLEVIE